jgi:hypothetical protein
MLISVISGFNQSCGDHGILPERDHCKGRHYNFCRQPYSYRYRDAKNLKFNYELPYLRLTPLTPKRTGDFDVAKRKQRHPSNASG